MTAILGERNYWEDIKQYQAGIQPVYPESKGLPDETVIAPQGIIQLFPNDAFIGRGYAYPITTKFSPTRNTSAVFPTPHDGVIFANRVRAHLGPPSLYI